MSVELADQVVFALNWTTVVGVTRIAIAADRSGASIGVAAVSALVTLALAKTVGARAPSE